MKEGECMKKKSLFSGGLYGQKSNGKWGKLNAGEIIERALQDGVDYSRLDKSQRDAVQNYYNETRERINNEFDVLQNYLNDTGAYSAAYEDFLTSGDGLSEMPETKLSAKTFDDILREFMRAAIFENDETHTPDGVESFYNDFSDYYDGDEPEIDLNEKWTYLRRLQAWNPSIIEDLGGISQALDEIESQMINGVNMDERITGIINDYEEKRADKIRKYNERKYKL